MIGGISTINVELTSRCNKECWMCGRRQLEKQNPGYAKTQGDMDFRIVIELARQIPAGTVVQLHWNGEPTLYPNLKDAAKAFKKAGCYVAMDTNGISQMMIDTMGLAYFDSITVSVIEADDHGNYQRQISNLVFMKTLLRKTMVNIRALGDVPMQFFDLSRQHNIRYIPRILHAPHMSKDYTKPVTIPEIGICLDLLHHPAIDRYGNVFPCVRLNPQGENVLGNVLETPLDQILNSDHRKNLIENHIEGNRHRVPLCCDCDYWGIPRG